MLKSMKAASMKRSMVWVIILFAIGLGLLAFKANDAIELFKGPRDLLDTPVEELEDVTYGKIDLSNAYVYGCYSEQYNKEKGSSITSTTHYYYLISVGDEVSSKYIGIKVKADKYSKMEKITKETLAYLSGEEESDSNTQLKIKGEMKSMEPAVYKHFKETMTKSGLTDEQIKEYSLNLMLVENSTLEVEYLIPAGGIICMLIAFIILIYMLAGGGQRKLKKKLNKRGTMAVEEAEADYATANSIGKNIRVGKKYTFIVKGTKNIVLFNDEIVWVYTHKVDHYRNGAHTGTTHSVIFFDKYKKKIEVKVDSEGMGIMVLDRYNSLTKSIVLGYSDELKTKFNNNFIEFLNLVYNHNRYGVIEQNSYSEPEVNSDIENNI